MEKPKLSDRYRNLSIFQKAAIWTGVALAIYTFIGFIVAPLILKAVLEKKIPVILGRPVTIGKIRLNPYSLSATVYNFRLGKKAGMEDFVQFKRLYVNLESLSILKKVLIIKSLALSGPSIDFDFFGDNTYSFSDLIEDQAAKKEQEEKGGPVQFSINNIEITDGNIMFHDLPKGKVHQVVSLNLAIPSISNLPNHIETYVQPAFSAVINGTSTSLGGVSKPFAESLATEIDIDMNGVNVPEYLAYIPNPTGLMLKSALMDIKAKLTYLARNNNTSRLSLIGTVMVRDINVADRAGRSYLNLPSLALTLADSNLLDMEVRLAEVAIDGPQLELLRRADGDLLPIALVSSAEPASTGPTAEEASAKGPAEGNGPEQALKLTIDRFSLENGEAIFNDETLAAPARTRLEQIMLKGSSLSTIPGTAGDISFAMALNETGRISGTGDLTIEPLTIKSSLTVDSVQLKYFQAYLSEQARIIIEKGTAGLQGSFEVAAGRERAAISCSGNGNLRDLTLTDTVAGDELIKWQELQVRNFSFTSQPPALSIEEIGWQAPYAKVLIKDDGAVNFATLARRDRDNLKETSSEASRSGEETNITIGRISLRKGRFQFRDRSIKPAYEASITDFNGMVTGLSSQEGNLATVEFQGKVDRQAPLAISGKINPLRRDSYADIKIDFVDFNMSPLSPYTGKFIGYKTDKGKLNLDMKYNIRGRKLRSTNKAFLDQFTLGEKVESSEATSLPVNLAISLLKNRQGEIHLDIPVSGDLDDPEFSIGGVVIQVIVNLIAKAATSPFALLGSLIPAGVDIQHIAFEPGSSTPTSEAADKLGLVAKVLYERPGLQMDIIGQFDRGGDLAALTRLKMEKQIKLAKLKKTGTSRKGGEIDYQGITLGPEEYPQYLEQVYREALKNASAEARQAAKEAKPSDETEKLALMEDFLMTRISIADDDLRLLAIDRANRVLTHLVEQGRVEAGRLFVVEPQTGETGEPAGPMVELTIK